MSTSSYRVKINIPEINAAAEQAFKETAIAVGAQFTKVISEPRTWDGYETARDIVDTGRLRASQQFVFTNPLECVFSWPVEYAVYQHEGYTRRDGVEVPGRPWTQAALEEFNVEAFFADRYRKFGGG